MLKRLEAWLATKAAALRESTERRRAAVAREALKKGRDPVARLARWALRRRKPNKHP